MTTRAAAASDGRGDEARLCRPRRVPRRSRERRGAARAPDLQKLRRGAARPHRSRARATGGGHSPRACRRRAKATTPRISPWSTVSATPSPTPITLNFSYGLGLVADGTGVLLNNELDDFAAKPGAPNAFGLLGGEANAPGPGKRPLSSMTPTIVLKDGKPFLVTGSPGGSRIITAVLQVISNVIDRKLPIADAVAEPRLHHQWLPDQVLVERGFSPRHDARAAGARPYRGGQPTADVDEFDPGHAGRLRRRRRSAHARRAGGGILEAHVPEQWGPTFDEDMRKIQESPHFNDALLATSAHFAISPLRKASSFSGDPPT